MFRKKIKKGDSNICYVPLILRKKSEAPFAFETNVLRGTIQKFSAQYTIRDSDYKQIIIFPSHF